MANQASTTYKVTGTRKAVSDLWNTLQSMNVNTKNIWLDDLAKFYGASTTRQSTSASVVISIGLSTRKTKTMYSCHLRQKRHGTLAMNFSGRLTTFFGTSWRFRTEWLSVVVRPITFTMKATTSLKRLVFLLTESHLRMLVMMFTIPSQTQSRNGAVR